MEIALGMIGICLCGGMQDVLLIYISTIMFFFQTWNTKLAYVLFSIAVELWGSWFCDFIYQRDFFFIIGSLSLPLVFSSR